MDKRRHKFSSGLVILAAFLALVLIAVITIFIVIRVSSPAEVVDEDPAEEPNYASQTYDKWADDEQDLRDVYVEYGGDNDATYTYVQEKIPKIEDEYDKNYQTFIAFRYFYKQSRFDYSDELAKKINTRYLDDSSSYEFYSIMRDSLIESDPDAADEYQEKINELPSEVIDQFEIGG